MAVSDAEFIALFTQFGAAQTAKKLNIVERKVYERRRRIEKKYDRPVYAPSNAPTEHYPERRQIDVQDGVVLVFSDAHYWPGISSTAHRALLVACKKFKPKVVICNGDAFDGASISRHAAIGWENSPSVADEIEACKERLGEIEAAAKGAKLFWPLGNHDARFESRLAAVAPEFVRVDGVHLKDHLPNWQPCWSVWINHDTVVKHRYKGGIHATHNNTLWASKNVVTGHLHSLKVTPYTTYGETADAPPRTTWGVDTGTLADPHGPQFRDYMEDNPRNWRSGFAVLTFKAGRLMWPELVHVIAPGVVEFRGEEWEV